MDSIVIISSMNGKTRRERPADKEKKEKKKTFEQMFRETREQTSEGFDMRA